jgi:glycosyltransferase involved in cell wall biosynthesis
VRIGIDLRPLQSYHRFRGVGVVLAGLLQALEPASDDHLVFYRYAHSAPESDLALSAGLSWEAVSLGAPPARQLVGSLRAAVRPGRPWNVGDQRLDVFLQPDVAMGLPTGAPVVAIAYDLIPLIFADQYLPRLSATTLRQLGPKGLVGVYLRRYLYRWQLRQLVSADRIIAISEATRHDLLKYFPLVPPGRISVAPLAASADYAPIEDRSALAKYGITKPYLLYAGGVDFRKNVFGLINAFHQLHSKRDCQLVLVGKDFVTRDSREKEALHQLLDNSPCLSDIIMPGYISNDELNQLYSGALAFVFPTLYEGFGIPVIEAMASGCPVVTYSNSSLPEVAGQAALLLDEKDDLAAALEDLCADTDRRERMRSAGLEQAARFTWSGTARQMVAAMRSAAEGAGSGAAPGRR